MKFILLEESIKQVNIAMHSFQIQKQIIQVSLLSSKQEFLFFVLILKKYQEK